MTQETKPAAPKPIKLPPREPAQRPRLLQMPGLIAVSVYMLLLAGVFVMSVVDHRASVIYLVFAVLFIASALGLLMLRRWAWALALAAVAIMVGLFLWTYTTQHLPSALVQGLVNLIIFLYLVRTDLRDKLK